jgi:galactokinase/mevalonate kinase-like predicted kinase
VLPGLNRLDYNGHYWPVKITPVHDEEILDWLEQHVHLVPLGPRKGGFQVLKDIRITASRVKALAAAADRCWDAILERNLEEFGRQVRASFEAQVSLFPRMATPDVKSAIREYAARSLGWKVSGAGGGGYLILVSRDTIPGAVKLKFRRRNV